MTEMACTLRPQHGAPSRKLFDEGRSTARSSGDRCRPPQDREIGSRSLARWLEAVHARLQGHRANVHFRLEIAKDYPGWVS